MSATTAPRALPPGTWSIPLSGPLTREAGALAAVVLALVPALLPLFRSGTPATHDGFLHVQRLIALESAARQGAPLVRWMPDLAYGYGQPLLLYYAPLSYLPALAARLFGAGYVASIEVASALALTLSALTMYLLARSMFGPLAAGVAAIVYALLPYQMVDLYVRGALAETWAFVWLPLGTWCLVRAWVDRRPRWSVGLAISVAGLVLTHNVTALLFLPALCGLIAVLWFGDRATTRAVALRPIAAVVLGLTLSAWFWLPAVAERGFVQIGETLEPELFASFFVRGWPPLRFDALYDYTSPVSTALGSPIFWPQLGLVQAAITLAGAAVGARTTGGRRAVAIWAIMLVVGSYVLQLGLLAPIYDVIPLLAFVQFPWRLLAPLGLGSAILAGALVETISARLAARVGIALAVAGASIMTAVALLDPEMTPVDERQLSIETIMRAELADYGLGTTHSGEYLPLTSGQRNAARFRKTLLDAGGDPARPAPSGASGLRVEMIDWRPDRLTADVSATIPERLVMHQFAFPGWTASIDGVPAATAIVGQLGLLGVDVPVGSHRVTLVWEWTAQRQIAAGMSLMSVLGLMMLGCARPWRPGQRRALLGLACVGLAVSVVQAGGSRALPEAASGLASAAHAPSDDTLTLVESRHDTSRLGSDGLIISRLTWLVARAPTTGYRAAVEAVAPDGTTRQAPWAYEPLSRLWERGELVPTTVALRLPPDFPPGEARLRVVFDRPAGLSPLDIGTLVVPTRGSARLPTSPGGGAAVGSTLRLSALLDAHGTEDRPVPARPGGSLDVTLRWETVGIAQDVERDLLTVTVLTGPVGDILSEPRRPGDWFAPLPFWQNGDVIQQRLRLAIPPSLARGLYPLSVRVYGRDFARGGASEPGASSARPRGRPLVEVPLGNVLVGP